MVVVVEGFNRFTGLIKGYLLILHISTETYFYLNLTLKIFH